MHNFLNNSGDKFSLGQAMKEEHLVCIGKMAMNDTLENLFAFLTGQLQSFGHILWIHAFVKNHTRTNRDFKGILCDPNEDGLYNLLSQNKRELLLRYALCIAPKGGNKAKFALYAQRQQKGKD